MSVLNAPASPSRTEQPIAVGGVGGSGTRMIAQLLQEAGYYIGSDLNEASDNLWAALLFNRRDVLIEPRAQFERLTEIFFSRMRGELVVTDEVRTLVKGLTRPRVQHDVPWMEERVRRLLSADQVVPRDRLWAWKIPATQIVAERLLEYHSGLRYIHVVRHGLDMALNDNQNQLRFFGPVFLNRDVEMTPRDSLSYWCAVQRRIDALDAAYPGRVYTVNFDRLCREPHAVSREMLDFCGATLSSDALDRFAAKVRVPASTGRFHTVKLNSFAEADLRYVEQCGYPLR